MNRYALRVSLLHDLSRAKRDLERRQDRYLVCRQLVARLSGNLHERHTDKRLRVNCSVKLLLN